MNLFVLTKCVCVCVCVWVCISGVSRQAVTVSLDQLWFGLERLWMLTSSPVQRKCWTAVTSASWYVCLFVCVCGGSQDR